MPRPGRMPMEKANNFPMAIKRVLKSMKKWHYAVIISILLAAFGSIISLVAPNRISDITTAIQKGLVPKTEKLSEIMDGLMLNFQNEEFMQEQIPLIMNDETISSEDKNTFNDVLTSLNNVSEEEKSSFLLTIPDSIMIKLINPVTIDNKVITKEDGLNTLKVLSQIDVNDSEKAVQTFDKLPKSVYNIVKPQMD